MNVSPTPDRHPVPAMVALRFGHAYLQMLADDAGMRILHLKGPAIDPELRDPQRPPSSDIDVLVDPSRVRSLLRELRSDGWSVETGFESGSPFAHAATLRHPVWGYVDVHRHWPGFEVARQSAFDLLWQDRQRTTIAEFACAVPSSIDQRILLCLNAVRNHSSPEEHPDVAAAWQGADEAVRQQILQRVAQLHAEVAFSAVTGDLESHRDASSYRLWKETSAPTDRLAEWHARFAAGNGAERVRLLVRAPWVNRAHLAVILGHPPSTRELLAAQGRRWRAGVREAAQRVAG